MFFKPSNTDKIKALWENTQKQVTHGALPQLESTYYQSYQLITQYANQHHLTLPDNFDKEIQALKNTLVQLLGQPEPRDIKSIEQAFTKLCEHFTTMQSNLTCQSRFNVEPGRQSHMGFKF